MSEVFGQVPGDVAPAARVYVTVGERRWELVPTGKLTWPEAKEAKRVCGMALVDMEAAISKADPDAWFAWMFVSIRRQWPALTERDLENAIGDTPVAALIETAEREAPEVADPDPPTQAAPPAAAGPPSAADGPQNGNGYGATTPPLSIPVTSGLPT